MKRYFLAFFAASCALMAQNAPAPASSKAKPPVPRAADGKPDLSGVWQGGGAGGLAFAIGAQNAKAARPDATANPAPAAPPRREPPPYQEWVQPRLKEIR